MGLGAGGRKIVLVLPTSPRRLKLQEGYGGQAVLEEGTGSVGTPIVQSNPVCSTYLHIAVERLFEHEDDDEYEDDFRPFASLKTC